MDSVQSGTVVTGVVAATGIVAAIYLLSKQSKKGVPSVEGGFFKNVKKCFGLQAHEWLLENSKTLGKVFTLPRLVSTPLYILCDADLARKVLDDNKSLKTGFYYGIFGSLSGGESFGNVVGHRWRHVRKSTAPFFAKAQRFYPKIEECLNDWVAINIEPTLKTGEAVEVRKAFCTLAADVFIRIVCNSQWIEGVSAESYVKTLLPIIKALTQALDLGKVLFPSMYQDMRDAKALSKQTLDLMRHVLESYRARKDEKGPLEDSLVAIIENNPEYENDEQRINDLWDFMLAGFDAPAVAFSWLLYDAARFPEEQAKLRKALANYKTAEEKYRSPEIRCFARESMRLNVAHPLRAFRLCGEDLKLKDSDVVIPKGSLTAIGFYAIMRDGDIFENPDEFIPSRWENPSPKALRAYMPFSGGPRNCIAMGLAAEQMHVVLANLVEKYQIDVVEHGVAQFSNTLSCDGAKVKFTLLSK